MTRSPKTPREKVLRDAVLRAARAWFYCDRPMQGRPSGLRILTTGEVWNPSPAEKRLARRISDWIETKAARRLKGRTK